MNPANEVAQFIAATREDNLRQTVGVIHERSRDAFPNNRRQIETYADFAEEAGAFYAHQFAHCVAPGASLLPHEAIGRALEVLREDYSRRNETLMHAFNDARERSMRRIFDIIAHQLMYESLRRYKRALLDRIVPPNDFDMKVEFIGQLFAWAPDLFAGLDRARPHKYASDYDTIVMRLIDHIDQFGREARRV